MAEDKSKAALNKAKDFEKRADIYNVGQVQVLDGLEAARKRPGVYIGSTSSRGLHHLVWEIIDNSIDERLAGFATKIEITIDEDGSVTVQDDGHGTPADIQVKTGRPALETVFTVLHAGGKFGSGRYKVPGGFHSVDASVVNALSAKLDVTIMRDGKKYATSSDHGRAVGEVKQTGTVPLEEHGTIVHLYPDPDIFTETTTFDDKILKNRIRELAFLNKGLRLTFADKHKESAETDVYHLEGGVKEYATFLNKGQEVLFDEPIYVEGNYEGIGVEVALQYTNGYKTTLMTFANNIHTYEGGIHEAGSGIALTRVVNDYARKAKILKDEGDNLSGEDTREGITAVVPVKHPNPQFEGQTKTKLGNSDTRTVVDWAFSETFSCFLVENPSVGRKIVEKDRLAERARTAAKRAHEVTRRKSGLEIANLPGKLADNTSNDPSISKLFIVEGNSAGGSAKQGRSRSTQTILPIRGKISNVGKALMDRILANQEIRSLFTVLGTGFGADFDVSKAGYHKSIITTDVDVDSAHIRTLFLTFLYNYMCPTIEKGYVCIACPPPCQVRQGKTEKYLDIDEELHDYLGTPQLSPKPVVQRYKGLGEMDPEQLWETTMNSEDHHLDRVSPEYAEDADKVFDLSMGSKVGLRRELIEKNAKYVENLDA